MVIDNWSKASLIDVIKLLNQPMPEVKPVNHRDAFPFNKEINFKNISFSYSPKSKNILDSLDICLTKGSKVGLIGETGSGKSTFLDILMGLLEPKEGAIHVDKEIVTHNNLHKLHSLIAHVPQHIYLADTSIAKNIAFGVNEEDIDYSLLKKVADEALVTKFLNEQEHDLSHLVGERESD